MILRALEGCNSPEKGIGYNKLFEIVHSKVGGSRRTFHKYLSELVSVGAVRKDKDSRHKAGVVIYKTSAATGQELLIELAERISKISATPPIQANAPGFFVDWKMVQLSDMLGRSLCDLTPAEERKEMTYAYARLMSGGKEAEMTLFSEDKRNDMTYGISLPGVRKSPPMKWIKLSYAICIPIPNSIPESAEKEIHGELAEIGLLAQEWRRKVGPLVEKALSYFPESERERARQSLLNA